MQFIDARDLAKWIVGQAERRTTGVFNATGPVPQPTLYEVLEICRQTANPEARLQWVEADFLLARDVSEFQDLPLWVVDAEWSGFMSVDVSKAVGAGLRFRPLVETVRDTLRWLQENPGWKPSRKQGVQIPPPGLSTEREAALLAEWKARSQ
jgi:2'-hydroxyisoflavone reductase